MCILNSAKDAEVCKERQALESAKRTLDCKVLELEQELDTQRREITAGKMLSELLLTCRVFCVKCFSDEDSPETV